MEGTADLKIVMLGKTGAGKSSTGNTILRENVFKTSFDANSETSKCEAVTKTIDGRNISVVDTPGYFSTDCTDKKLKAEITKCIIECSPGPHAFVILLKVEKQTPEEKKVVEEILKTFGEEALKYAVVMFTRGDQLEHGRTIRQFVDNNDHLKKLVQKCKNRLHVIDNKYWNNPTAGHGDERNNDVQIKKLLNTIDQMVKQNGGGQYTNELLQTVEQAIKVEEAKGKTREEAKQSVWKWLLIKTVGIGIGTLLGALLGTTAALSVVIMSCRGAAIVGMVVGVVGGAIGAEAAEEAETVKEAAERAAGAVIHTVLDPIKKIIRENTVHKS